LAIWIEGNRVYFAIGHIALLLLAFIRECIGDLYFHDAILIDLFLSVHCNHNSFCDISLDQIFDKIIVCFSIKSPPQFIDKTFDLVMLGENIAVLFLGFKIGRNRIRMYINVDEVECFKFIVYFIKPLYLEPKLSCYALIFVFPDNFCPTSLLLKEEIIRDIGRQIQLGSYLFCCHIIQLIKRALNLAYCFILKLDFNSLYIIIYFFRNRIESVRVFWVFLS
jgi:hypothetical protein